MLHSLSINNFALIEKTALFFDKEMNIITGETGAGKSILLGALGLVLGERADQKKIHNKAQKCIVEACFKDYPSAINQLLEDQELDIEDDLFLRREINKSGKSRAFVNDTPVKLDFLSNLAASLIDLNRQFDIVEITESQFHLEMVDAKAGHADKISEFRNLYSNWLAKQKELNELRKIQGEAIKQRDYNLYQYNELEEANLIPGELERIESDLKKSKLSEKISEGITLALETLSENAEFSIEDKWLKVLQHWRDFADIDEKFREVFSQMELMLDEVRTLASTIGRLDPLTDANFNVGELTDRLDVINKLCLKHNVKREEELIEIFDNIALKLKDSNDLETRISTLEKDVLEEEAMLLKKAKKISSKREAQFKQLEKDINLRLKNLSMEFAKVQFVNKHSDKLSKNGIDDIELKFSPGKGAEIQSIKQVASGGERSRLMLCMKSTVAGAMELPTLIFDEIDTGVSGAVASKMGKMMKELSRNHQMISITHLPQIASTGNKHFNVIKEARSSSMISEIVELNKDERIIEIAKMLSSDPPSDTAILNAQELLNK